jgi:hypothetical protein
MASGSNDALFEPLFFIELLFYDRVNDLTVPMESMTGNSSAFDCSAYSSISVHAL